MQGIADRGGHRKRSEVSTATLLLAWALMIGSPIALADDPMPEAVMAAQSVADQTPADGDALITLGHACFDAGLFERSLSAFRRASDLAPRNLEAIINTGVVLNTLDRPEEGLTYFKHALSIDPGNLNAMCNEAQAYYAIGDVAVAVARLQQVIDIDNASQIAHFYLGICFVESGIYKEALREWEAVVAIDSESEAGRQASQNIDRLTPLITGD